MLSRWPGLLHLLVLNTVGDVEESTSLFEKRNGCRPRCGLALPVFSFHFTHHGLGG